MIEHLRGVGDMAGSFAAAFGEEAAGRMVGLYHDIGKYSQEFQAYLRQGGGRKFDHSTAGALEIMKRKSPLSIPAAFCVAGVTFLSDSGRRHFLQEWQERKREAIVHPFLEEKIVWGLVPYVQSLLLARTIRGDLDEYPAFLWK